MGKIGKRTRAAREAFEGKEELSVEDRTDLHHLQQSRRQLRRRQRRQKAGIGHGRPRVVEETDAVLRLRQIDAGLAADGIAGHLRETRGAAFDHLVQGQRE